MIESDTFRRHFYYDGVRSMKHQIARGFAMMPFDEFANDFWKAARRAADRFEYLHLERYGSDHHSGGDELFTAIRKHIKQADFAIADFTPTRDGSANCNVLTEAGIAIGADVTLNVMARANSFDSLRRTLPSDWNGFHVEVFPSGKKKWRATFEEFYRRILHDLDRPPARRVEPPRRTDAEQLKWLMQLVRRLRTRCDDLYRSPANGVAWRPYWPRYNGMPDSYFFRLRSQQPPNESVDVGVYFKYWARGGTPLFVTFEEDGKRKASPVKMNKPLDEITSDEAIGAFVQTIDKALRRITPSLKTPESLGRRITKWKSRGVAEAIPEVCQRLGLEANGGGKWTHEGLLVDVLVEDSDVQLRIGIDFERWAEREVTPCWISIRPRDSVSPEILRAINLPWLQAHREPGELLVPVPTEGDFAKNLQSRMERVLAACPVSKSEQQADLAVLDAEGDLPGEFDTEDVDSEDVDSDDLEEGLSMEGDDTDGAVNEMESGDLESGEAMPNSPPVNPR